GGGSGRCRRGGRRTSLSPRTCGSSGPRTSPRSPPTRSSACSVPSAPTTSSSNSAGAGMTQHPDRPVTYHHRFSRRNLSGAFAVPLLQSRDHVRFRRRLRRAAVEIQHVLARRRQVLRSRQPEHQPGYVPPEIPRTNGTLLISWPSCWDDAGGQSALALRLLLAVFSSKISSGANRPFGEEFRAARRVSEDIGAQLVLGDRPIEITLERALKSLSWDEKTKLVISLFRGITSTTDMPQDEKAAVSPYELYEKLSSSYPSLLQPLVHERDM
uniref:Uncharacterized protein n=1 Tax=Aegilops tauschii subsp. strangulata TaxID=200361 RepID=A0A453RQ81_AEGTS